MPASFHYLVKAKLIRSSKSNTQNLIEFEKCFEHENPIIAREQAFNHYQNYIDVLLEGKGKKYISDIQARIDLYTHIDSGTAQSVCNNKLKIDFNDDIDKGISIYMVSDKAFYSENIKVSSGDRFLIHSIEHFDKNDLSILLEGVLTEYEFYKYFDIDTVNNLQTIDFTKCGFSNIGKKTILKTPFDWSQWHKNLEIK